MGKWFDRPGKGIDARKFWDGVSGGGKELVVKVYVTAEITEIQEMGQGGRDDRLSGVDFLLGDGTKHCLELSDQIQRREGPRAELVLGVDLVESDAAEAGANGRMKIGCDALLQFKISGRDGVSADSPCGGSGRIGVGHRDNRACANSAPGQDVLGA